MSALTGVLSDRGIAGAVILGGLAGQNDRRAIAQWVAIALAESSGRVNARNACCTGLWQIHKVHAGSIPGAPSSESEFRDWLSRPIQNAKAAKNVYDRQGFNAWEVYTNGRYRAFMGRGEAAASNPDVTAAAEMSGSDASVGDIIDVGVDVLTPEPLEAIGAAITNLFTIIKDAALWIGNPANWIRIIQVGGGLALGIAAASIVVKPVVTDIKKTVSPV